jgi:phosphatidylserine/phosphatidylglycerophosphate/cardiolipin synthase-like enzyme
MFSKGNREWHVILEDRNLAELFEQYIKYDRDGSKAEAEQGEHEAELDVQDIQRLPDLFVPIEGLAGPLELAVVEPVAPSILPSTAREIDVQPVLTPDNYLDRIMELLRSATRSVYLQFAYINFSDRPADRGFTEMLALLADLSFRPGMDVRIIVDSRDAADKIRRLVQAGFNEAAFRKQANIHNKGIVVDGKVVLVSSANWSADGVLRNRDAGLIIHDEEIADYYQKVFLDDWESRADAFLSDDPPVLVASEGAEIPAGMVRMSWRDYYG